jgi:hypothetical protein
MACVETNRPISAIFVDLVNQFTALVRKESQLARAEMGEKIGEIGSGIANPGLGDSASGGSRRLSRAGFGGGLGQPDSRRRGTGDRACPTRHRCQSSENSATGAHQNTRAATARCCCSHSASEE